LEEMFHLLIRENAIPSTDTIIQGRVDYTYDCDSALAHETINLENMLAVFKKCRPFYTELIQDIIPGCGKCNGTGCPNCKGSGLHYQLQHNIIYGLFQKLQKAHEVDQGRWPGTTYNNCVKSQAKRMNAHNEQRNIMEKEGEKYRTYTILKALYNINGADPAPCKNTQKLPEPHKTKKACNEAGNCAWMPFDPEKAAKAVYTANPEYMLGFIKDKSQKAYFKALPKKMKKYQKLSDLPITLQELKEHLSSARKTITTKFKLDSEKFVQLMDDSTSSDLEDNSDDEAQPSVQSKKKRSSSRRNRTTLSSLSYGHVRTNMSPSDRRRRLADAARMEEKDMDDMSPSELALHRRRLAHGAHVSPVLAALMDEIEQAQRNN